MAHIIVIQICINIFNSKSLQNYPTDYAFFFALLSPKFSALKFYYVHNLEHSQILSQKLLHSI